MKKTATVILILMSFISIYSQSLRLGIKTNFLTGNKYLKYEAGPALSADYFFQDLPVAVNICTRFYLAELSPENNLSTGYTLGVWGIGITTYYYPVQWAIEPYIGAGVFYNSNDLQSEGIGSANIYGSYAFAGYLHNNISGEITLGINFSADTPINFIAEVTRTFNKPGYELNTLKPTGSSYSKTVQKEKFDFNSLFLNIGLAFKL